MKKGSDILKGWVLGLAIFVMCGSGQAGDLKALLSRPEMKAASVGVFVVPLEGEAAVAEWRADKALIPASTMKAVTTATALQILGPEFVFETRAYLKGDNLVVKGGGDPTFCSTSLTGDFVPWVTALKNAGVRKIAGDVVIDSSRFEEQRAPNDWPSGDVGNYYGAGPSGVNFHLNTFAVTFATGSVGKAAKVSKVWPRPPGVKFVNHMRTGTSGSGDQGYLYGGPGAKVMTLRGTVPARGSFTIRGALPDPPLMCGEMLRDFLKEEGIEVQGVVKVERVDVGKMKPLAVTKSPALLNIVKGTNHRSVNLYADSIFKVLSREGTTKASAAKIKSHWKSQGVDVSGWVMHDGSGLSPRGVVTPRQMAMILKKTRVHKTGEAFRKSLPVAGRSGTMVVFGRGTAAEGRVQAKSGSMTGVRTYAGYFTGRSGREFAFSLMVNNATGSSKRGLEAFLAGLVEKL